MRIQGWGPAGVNAVYKSMCVMLNRNVCESNYKDLSICVCVCFMATGLHSFFLPQRMFDWHVLARERCCAKGLFPWLHIHNVLLFTINTYAGSVTTDTICTRHYANEICLSPTIHHSSIIFILIPQISKSLSIFQSIWAKISVCPYLPFHFLPPRAFILDTFLLTFSLSSCDWSGDRAHCSVH